MYLHHGPNVYKIGYSTDINRRVTDYTTSYIDEWTIVYSKEVTSKECEMRLHKLMDVYRVKPNREFFDCPLEHVKRFIDTL